MEKREGARNNSTRLVSMTHFSTGRSEGRELGLASLLGHRGESTEGGTRRDDALCCPSAVLVSTAAVFSS